MVSALIARFFANAKQTSSSRRASNLLKLQSALLPYNVLHGLCTSFALVILLCQFDTAKVHCQLVHCLEPLLCWIAVIDDTTARLKVCNALLNEHRTNRDAGINRPLDQHDFVSVCTDDIVPK